MAVANFISKITFQFSLIVSEIFQHSWKLIKMHNLVLVFWNRLLQQPQKCYSFVARETKTQFELFSHVNFLFKQTTLFMEVLWARLNRFGIQLYSYCLTFQPRWRWQNVCLLKWIRYLSLICFCKARIFA